MNGLEWMVPRLTRALRAMEDGQHLVVSRIGSDRYVSGNGPNRYVQFARFGDQIRLESVGERHLEPEDRLSESQARALEQLGFNDPDKGGNHWLHWDVPSQLTEAAACALMTLAAVHGVEFSEQLDFVGPAEVVGALAIGDDGSGVCAAMSGSTFEG